MTICPVITASLLRGVIRFNKIPKFGYNVMLKGPDSFLPDGGLNWLLQYFLLWGPTISPSHLRCLALAPTMWQPPLTPVFHSPGLTFLTARAPSAKQSPFHYT